MISQHHLCPACAPSCPFKIPPTRNRPGGGGGGGWCGGWCVCVGGGGGGGGGWCVCVVVVVVVVRTRCNRSVFVDTTTRMHLIIGGHVPVDTTPRPCTCVQGPKNSPHQLINAMMSGPTRRKPQRVQLWELGCVLHDGTCGTRWTRTPGTSITKPCEAASAPRQGCHRRRMNTTNFSTSKNCGRTTVSSTTCT